MEDLWDQAGSAFFSTLVFFGLALYWRKQLDDGDSDAETWYYFNMSCSLVYALLFLLISLMV